MSKKINIPRKSLINHPVAWLAYSNLKCVSKLQSPSTTLTKIGKDKYKIDLEQVFT